MPNESDLETITVSGLPKKLLREIKKLAESEHRNRSNFIVKTLTEAVREAKAGRVEQVEESERAAA
jgi:metal-responsive CopG/Arc/MetJ family transcriptional regulator